MGQTTAFFAQLVKNLPPQDFIQPGIGNLAKFLELSNQEAKAEIQALCDGV